MDAEEVIFNLVCRRSVCLYNRVSTNAVTHEEMKVPTAEVEFIVFSDCYKVTGTRGGRLVLVSHCEEDFAFLAERWELW